jgi:hypothetical protein
VVCAGATVVAGAAAGGRVALVLPVCPNATGQIVPARITVIVPIFMWSQVLLIEHHKPPNVPVTA